MCSACRFCFSLYFDLSPRGMMIFSPLSLLIRMFPFIGRSTRNANGAPFSGGRFAEPLLASLGGGGGSLPSAFHESPALHPVKCFTNDGLLVQSGLAENGAGSGDLGPVLVFKKPLWMLFGQKFAASCFFRSGGAPILKSGTRRRSPGFAPSADSAGRQ
jgi:hypothetical protein